MTDKEIIKALEEHYRQIDARYSTYLECGGKSDEHEEKYIYMIGDTIGLINRQRAKIKNLRKEADQFADIGKMYSEIKAEAIKEFAKAYKDQIKNYTGMFTDEGFYVSHEAVLDAVDFVLNKTLGEMVEENNG